MAYVISDNNDNRVNLYFDDEQLETFSNYIKNNPNTIMLDPTVNIRRGDPLPAELAPKIAYLEKGKLNDFNKFSSLYVVSERFKDAVESINPACQQFFPLKVFLPSGAEHATKYYLLNVVCRIESIIEEESNLKAMGRGRFELWAYEQAPGEWKCGMDSSIIGDRAMWTELRYRYRWFISDKVAAEIAKRRLTGFYLSRHCEEI